MEYRLGTCSSCKARYKVPATFTAARARCKTCGGAVEFGSVLSDVPRPPRSDGERAARSEPPRAPAQPAPPAPIPATRPVRASPPAPQPDAPQSAPAAPAARASESPRRSPARERASAPAARAPAAAEKPRNWPLILGSIVALIALVVAVVWFVLRGNDADAAENDGRKQAQASAVPAPAPTLSAARPEPEVPADESAKPPGAPQARPQAPTAPALPPADRALDADLAQQADFDLATLAEVEPLASVDAAAQQELAGWVALFVDPASGAAGQRAGDELVARGKAAVPPILNALKSVDVATDEGRRTGERIQKQLLAKICNGTNFGWKHDLEPESVAYNEKAIAMWFRAWESARASDAAWAELARTSAPKEKLDDF